MTTIVFQDGAPVLRGWRQVDDFTVSKAARSVSSGTHADILDTVKDITYNAESNTAVLLYEDFAIANALDNPTVTVESLTPNVCAVDALGGVVPLTAGTCIVQMTGQCGSRQASSLQFLTESGATVYNSVSAFIAGSLRAYLYDQQIAALTGVTPGATAQRACLVNPATLGDSGGGVNPNNFLMSPTAAAISAGFTPLPTDLLAEIMDSAAGAARWRAWITPHHYITWDGHLSATRTPTATRIDVSKETAVYYSATPWAGALAKLLPHDPRAYLPYGKNFVDQAISCWARLFNTYETVERRWVQPAYKGYNREENFVTGDTRIPFRKRAIDGTMVNGGDSGSPVFCGIGGDIVMLGVTSTQYNLGGTSYFQNETDYVSLIQSAVDALNASGPYTVGVVDLGPTGMNFTSYA